MFVLGVLVFVLGLLVSIALHEIGHLVPAKRFGVRVSQYMVGFGPTLFSRTRGETEYGLKAIPLGGYVRLVGMFPPADVVGVTPKPGRIAEIAQSAREASAHEIRPGEDHRAFYRLSTPKKVTVMLGGPFMNLVLAAVFVGIALVGIGVPAAYPRVAEVSECIQPADVEPGTACTAADPPAPAAAAGIAEGDLIVSIDAVPVVTWADAQSAIRGAAGRTVTVVVERDGELVELPVTMATAQRPVVDGEGRPVLDADGEFVMQTVGFFGVSPDSRIQRQSIAAVPREVARITGATVGLVVALPVKVWEVGEALVTGQERSMETPISIVGVGRIAGEIASVPIEESGLQLRIAGMLMMLAALNIALFAFNLIPLPPLDGGHVAGALWEGARRQWARWRGESNPRPADTARLMPLAYGVFVVLLGMGLVLIVADFVAPISLTG